ncbi:MAG: SBBP repeat-containing protein [Bacteroidetes bacterium]|nr:SBBP repeat-containing protein [Bacteroidota bacterium]
MRRKLNSTVFICSIIGLSIPCSVFSFSTGKARDKEREDIQQFLKSQPVRFLENKGQMYDMTGKPVSFVLFKASVPGMDMYITEKGLTYSFVKYEEDPKGEMHAEKYDSAGEENRKAEFRRVDVELKGGSVKRENIIKEFPSVANYHFFYSHCQDGVYGVKEYEKITVKDVYPGIDWVFYNSDEKGFKYDFIVHPGANPSLIRLAYSGADLKNINGNIQISTSLGFVTDNRPVSYIAATRQSVESSFDLSEQNEISFSIDNYYTSQTLVIDPQINWYTRGQIGGFGGVLDMEVNQVNGDFAVTGYYQGIGYPLLNPGGGAYFQTSGQIIIMLFNSKGVLKWSTLYGSPSGNADNYGYSICFDAAGNIFLSGRGTTAANGFPLQNPGGGAFYLANNSGFNTIILKFDPNGVRLWATHFGWSWNTSQGGHEVEVDAAGNLFVVGSCGGSGSTTALPVLNPGGGAYFQGTGSANDNMFIAKFTNSGVLLWSTYFAGSGGSSGADLAIDNNGNIFCTGYAGTGFPVLSAGGYFDNTVNGISDVFVVKFNNNGVLQWSTYFGGNGNADQAFGIDCDNLNNIIITGVTNSTAAFPLQNPGGGAYYQATNAGVSDIFVSKFTPATNLFWSTYYGGAGDDVGIISAVFVGDVVTDNCNNIYVVGATKAPATFPTYNPGCGSFYYNYGNQAILRFSPAGVRSWATLYGESNSPASQRATMTCAYDKNSRCFYTGGEIYGPSGPNPPPVDPGGGAYFNSYFGQTGDDSFIAKFSPDTLKLSSTFSPPSVCSCNGSATVNITSCGTPPYNYKWSNGSQALNVLTASNTLTGLCSGNYWVEVTDAACNKDTVFYTFPGGLSLSSTSGNVICAGSCNGSSTITPAGGSSPYGYLWSNGQTAQTATGLCTGTYSVVVTDAANCTSVLNVTINKLTVSTSQTNVLCSGNTTGNAVVSVAGNTGTVTYSWLPTGQTTKSVTGLTAGIYTVRITDANGCSLNEKVYIDEPEPLIITPTSQNISCTTSGSASISTSGGIIPYTYSWNTGQTSSTISCPTAGDYTVTLTDANGCTSSQVFNITGTSPVSASFTTSSTCTGSSVTFTNTGSTGTYSWLISPLNPNVSGTTTNFTYTFLTAGSYSVTHTVSDGTCNNSITETITMINCAGPAVTATGNSVCSGNCATVSSNGTGGSAPYTYSWSNGSTTQNINPCPVSTATYTVTIKDAGGNTSTSMAVVTVNPAVSVTTTVTNISCNGGTNGSASANVSSGTPGYTYSWSNVSGSGSVVSGLTAGTYSVMVTDSKGCTASSTVNIAAPPALAGQFAKGTSNCAGCGCKEWIMINAAGGTNPYSYSWPDGYVNRYKNQLCPGAYTVNIKDKNGCSVNVNFTTP